MDGQIRLLLQINCDPLGQRLAAVGIDGERLPQHHGAKTNAWLFGIGQHVDHQPRFLPRNGCRRVWHFWQIQGLRFTADHLRNQNEEDDQQKHHIDHGGQIGLHLRGWVLASGVNQR